MIKKITDPDTLYNTLNKGAPSVYTEKIRSLADAYGIGNEFCTFYTQTGGTVISNYYNSAVAARCGVRPGDRLAELMEFLMCGMFRKIIMPLEIFSATNVDANVEKLILMKYDSGKKTGAVPGKETIRTDFSINDIYEIASDGFDIDFNNWYTDTNHMLRHGISKLYALENNTCAVKMFSSSGISYLSYICTRKEERGKGLATRLVGSICAEEALAGNSTYIFCAEELCGFYENIGFVRFEEAVEITI